MMNHQILFYLFVLIKTISTQSTFDIKSIQNRIKDVISLRSDLELATIAQMIDASQVLPSGIAAGNIYALGHFDECYNIHQGNIYGKYCSGNVLLPPNHEFYNLTQLKKPELPRLYMEPRASLQLLIVAGLCLPHNFNVAELSTLTDGVLVFDESSCYSQVTAPKLSAAGYATIGIIAAVLALALISTVYDVVLHYSKQKPKHEILLAFSFLSNGRKMMAKSTNPDQLLSLNGIKAVSMLWVVLGHDYSNIMSAPLTNLLEISNWRNNPANMFVLGSTVSVDTFFVVGGLVTVYTFMKAHAKGIKFNIILYYIHRFLRLTPALGIVALVHANLLDNVATGPLWASGMNGMNGCRDAWWKTIFYISNFFTNSNANCIPQAWYLSVDMQLFVLSPLVLLPLVRWPKKTLYGIGALIVLGFVLPLTIVYAYEIYGMMSDEYMTKYYIQTHTRFGPYVIGMLAGYFVYNLKQRKEKLQLPMAVVCCAWIVALGLLVSTLYAGFDLMKPSAEKNLDANAFFLAFDRNVWSFGIVLVIYLCTAGYGGPVDGFLSSHIFQIITKLSYSIYLVHFAVIKVKYASVKNPFKFSDLYIMHSFWGDFVFTTFLSVFLCLGFESPIIILEKFIFGK